MMHPTIIKIIGILLYVMGGGAILTVADGEDPITTIIAGLIFVLMGGYLHISSNEIKKLLESKNKKL